MRKKQAILPAFLIFSSLKAGSPIAFDCTPLHFARIKFNCLKFNKLRVLN